MTALDGYYREARRAAEAGIFYAGALDSPRLIPGLYGLKLGSRVVWHEDKAVRLARVDAFFGKSLE